MTSNRMIELLEIEHECMLRNSHGDCDRNCTDCELAQDDDELHEMYTNVIALLKEQEAVKVKDYADIVDGIQVGYCPKCDRKIVWNPEKEETVAFCKYCGQAVKWE